MVENLPSFLCCIAEVHIGTLQPTPSSNCPVFQFSKKKKETKKQKKKHFSKAKEI